MCVHKYIGYVRMRVWVVHVSVHACVYMCMLTHVFVFAHVYAWLLVIVLVKTLLIKKLSTLLQVYK